MWLCILVVVGKPGLFEYWGIVGYDTGVEYGDRGGAGVIQWSIGEFSRCSRGEGSS